MGRKLADFALPSACLSSVAGGDLLNVSMTLEIVAGVRTRGTKQIGTHAGRGSQGLEPNWSHTFDRPRLNWPPEIRKLGGEEVGQNAELFEVRIRRLERANRIHPSQ